MSSEPIPLSMTRARISTRAGAETRSFRLIAGNSALLSSAEARAESAAVGRSPRTYSASAKPGGDCRMV